MPAPDPWRTAVRGLIPALAEVPDAELLDRFRTARDEAAFELLVYRHGPLVWSACRRMLGDHHAAEDAFQATFLALARQAGSIRAGQSVPGWLHRVAVRAGIHLRRRRRALASLGDDVLDSGRGPLEAADDRETAGHIDAAIDRLSERLRQVFILCELHGYSLADAAARLGVPIGTVASRLGRARERLRKALAARGLAVGSIAGMAVAEIVPTAIRGASVCMASGGAKITPMVMALSRRAVGRPGRIPMYGLACSIAAGFMAVAIALGRPEPPATPKPSVKEPPSTVVRKDAEGVPLPDGAVARLGSSRFRHAGQPTSALVFSLDGRLVASPHSNGGVCVFEAATGRTLFQFRIPEDQYPTFARFLADGKTLSIGSQGSRAAELTVYRLPDGKPSSTTRFDVTGPGNRGGLVRVIDVIADGSRVLVEDLWGRGIYLRDLKTGKDIWSFEVSEVVSTQPFTADGKWFAVAASKKVELRDAATGEVAVVCPDPGPGFPNRFNATLAADGRVLLISKDYDALAVLDPKGEVPMQTFPAGDRGLVRGLISPDGRYLVGLGQMVSSVWDLGAKDGQRPIARLPGAWSGGFSPDGKTLALDNDGIVTLVGTGDWKPLPQSADPPSLVYPVRFALDGKRVVGHTRAGWVIYPAAGGPPTRPAANSDVHLFAQADVSGDGRVAVETVYVRGESPEEVKTFFEVTNLTTGASRRVPRDKSSWSWRPPRLSPDGRFVAADLGFPEFAVWDLASGEVIHRRALSAKELVLATVPGSERGGLALSANAVATDGAGTLDGPRYTSITITDHRTGRTSSIEPPPSAVRAGFGRDGSRLVLQTRTGGVPGKADVSVWDVQSGRRLVTWPRPGGITGLRETVPDLVALSPDNRALLVGDAAGLLSLVEVATGKERISFRHAGGILSVAIDPEGTKAVSSGFEGPVYVWDLLGDPGRWDAAKADAVWSDLASTDAKVAYAAIRKLGANPADAVGFHKDRVKVPAVPDDVTIAGWLKGLDAPAFADREKAQRELTAVAGLIRPKLEAARKTATAEAGRRLDQVLKTLDGPVKPEGLREIRACEVLEGVRSPEAVRVLKSCAGGPPGYRLTTEATESLGRLGK